MTVVLGASAVVLSTHVSDTFMYLCGFTLIIVTFVAPAILMWAQKYKKWVKMITSLQPNLLILPNPVRFEVLGMLPSQL